MAKDQVEIFVVLREIRKFLDDAGKAAKAVKQIGNESATAGEKAKLGAKSLLKWAGGAAVVYGATRFLKGAIRDVETFGLATKSLTVSTNLDTKTASEWVGVLGERHIAVRTF